MKEPSEKYLNSTAKLTARIAELEAALADLLPTKLLGESWNLPDNEHVAINTTFGKLKHARTTLGETTDGK